MSLMKWAVAMAVGCALSLAATSANSVIFIRNATGTDATDFHIEFTGPADKLKVTSGNFNQGVGYPAPSPKQNQLDFAGGSGVKNGAQMNLKELTFGKLGAGGLEVKSWYFTGPGGKQLTGEPLILVGNNQYMDLAGLAAKNIAIVPVPEPAAWGLMIFGLGLAGAVLRRRRHLAGRELAA